MRNVGWSISHDNGDNHEKVIRWTITPPPKREVGNDARNTRDTRETLPDAGIAGNAGMNSGFSLEGTDCVVDGNPQPKRVEL